MVYNIVKLRRKWFKYLNGNMSATATMDLCMLYEKAEYEITQRIDTGDRVSSKALTIFIPTVRNVYNFIHGRGYISAGLEVHLKEFKANNREIDLYDLLDLTEDVIRTTDLDDFFPFSIPTQDEIDTELANEAAKTYIIINK